MIIRGNLEITNEAEVISRVEYAADEQFDLTELNDKPVMFLDDKLSVNSQETKDSKVVWIYSGMNHRYTKKPILISLVKEFGRDDFRGFFVGTVGELYRKLAEGSSTVHYSKESEKLLEKKVNEKIGAVTEQGTASAHSISSTKVLDAFAKRLNNTPVVNTTLTPITKQIYENLLINNWKSVKGLDVFIKICASKVKEFVDNERSEYYRMNSRGDVIINTGLIDKFNSDVIIYYKHYAVEPTYRAEAVVNGKNQMLEFGYEKKDTDLGDLEPINFLDGEESIDDITLEDFDVSTGALEHMIETNRERLGDLVEGWADEILAERIRAAVTLGIRMYKRDKTYFKPFYSAKRGGVSWMIPLYLRNSRQGSPEAVLVFRKVGEFYEIKTAFKYSDDVVDRVTALSLYGNSWM